MVKISNTSFENEIHGIDSPSNEDSKNLIFCQEGLNFEGGREGQPEYLEKMAKNREIYCYAN